MDYLSMDYLSIISMYDSLVLFSIIAIIAAIIVSVVVWVLYVGRNATNKETSFSKFFRFDHFYVDELLKGIYLFLATVIAFGSIVTFISSFMVSIDFFFQMIISSIVGFIVGEVLLRVLFELLLMFVRFVRDTRAIRETLGNQPQERETPLPAEDNPAATPAQDQLANERETQSPIASPMASVNDAPLMPTNTAPMAANPYFQPQPLVGEQPLGGDDLWECPQCHHMNYHGKFCGSCGAPRP